MPFNRSKINMGGRYQQQFSSKDDGGAKSDVIDWNKAGKVIWFKPNNKGQNKFNIIPFEIKSPNHPAVVSGLMKVGDWDYVLDVWVHRNIGPSEATMLCLKKTYGKKCAHCDAQAALYEEGKEEEAKRIKATRRCYYNVQPWTTSGMADHCEIFNVSHYLFTKELMEEANACADGTGVVEFANIDDGKLIECRGAEESSGAQKCTKFKSFKFHDRREEIPDEVLASAISMDDFLKVPTLAEQAAALYGDGEDDPALDPPEETTTTRPPITRHAAVPAKVDAPVEQDYQEPEENLASEESPPVTHRQTRPMEPTATNDCPQGFNYGTDCDTKPGCAKCPDAVYNKCHASKRAVSKK